MPGAERHTTSRLERRDEEERPPPHLPPPALAEISARRRAAHGRFFGEQAERIAALCHRMAERFARGGRLLAFGLQPQARSDVRHVAVEFVHPVIVGKRALPALGLTREAGELGLLIDLLAGPEDMVIGFGVDEGTPEEKAACRAALRAARRRGCLTLAFAEAGAEWELLPPSADPFVRQELVETLYHFLWESVHVFFEHRGLLAGRTERARHDAGPSRFLYPFLDEREKDLEAVIADVTASVLIKAEELDALRSATFAGSGEALLEASRELRARLEAGGTVLACGNGGSATDAMDLVADLRAAPQGWPAARALDLTEDSAILTALTNDVGADAIFARQVIAHGKEGDVAVTLSTSGGSRNLIEALAEARRRGLRTIAFVGYDGGRIAAEGLADHVIVTPSQYVPRIQEAQASAYHALRELAAESPDEAGPRDLDDTHDLAPRGKR